MRHRVVEATSGSYPCCDDPRAGRPPGATEAPGAYDSSAGGGAMPLSENEQRLFDQIERALYAEDPKFASTIRGARLRKPTRRRRVQGVALFVVGLVLLVLGIAVQWTWLGGIPVVSVV